MPIANPDIPNIPNTPDVGMPLSFGPARPLVLLPVRLETRFFPQADGGSELRVRVYPDRVHIDSHEPELTADEITWGQHFWEQTWRAGNDPERGKAAWQQLADRFDPPRAAWVARALQPLNPADRPSNPLADDRTLTTAPHFPSPATKSDPWTRAPWTRVLPNQWIVLGYKSGRLVVNVKGAAIPDLLPAGPDPRLSSTTAATPASDDQLAIDEGMKWIVDFDAAEHVGMGIRARLAKDDAAAGLDFLVVMGIRDSTDRMTDWTPNLAGLLDAHHYTAGLGFVAQGTPSNNTKDAPSGFSSNDPGHETSYLAERAAPPIQPGDGSNADVLATALGLSAAGPVFANLANATATEQLDARHMNTALWQATWGYFLLQMLGVGVTSQSPLTDDDIAWARRHFMDHVRAGGPLPALRIGKQPYGILPVSSLNAWKPQPGEDGPPQGEVALRDFLIRLRDVWRRDFPEVPALGRTDNIAKDLAEILSMDGLSSNYSMRHLIGRQATEHLWVYLSAQFFFTGLGISWQPQPRIPITNAQFTAWFAKHDELTATLLQTLGISWRPRLARAVFSPYVMPLRGELVQADRNRSLTPNYIETLLAARSLDTIRFDTLHQTPPQTLLYLLLRHSMLLEYTTAASRLLTSRGLLQPAQRREPELVDLPLGQLMLTVWRQMVTKIAVQGVPDPIEVGKYLLGFTSSGEPDLAREPQLKQLSEFRASLAYLKSLNPARLEQLMTGTLDLCSHRLDAWITSFASKRLAQMRKADPAGLLIGSYGWVINLKPATAQTSVAPPAGELAPIYQSADSPGFIHTPSLTQAATAAVLRSGHLAHAGGENPNDLLAIDLSSERVRLAAWLLDGVRQGQPLGALLGYRFERRLQEAGQAEFIAYFRDLAPLVARKLESTAQPGQSVENIAANNVVDGLVLERQWLAALDLLRRTLPPPAMGGLSLLFAPLVNKPPQTDLADARTALEAELNALADSVDAVSDALMAETVHQVVRGNPPRAASTVESIAGGETPPPDLDVVRTPRTGIALTHRIVKLFSGDPRIPPAWRPRGSSPRASAEPYLNAWVANLLCDPSRVRAVVERVDPSTGEVLQSAEMRLDALGAAPLDFIYAVEGGTGGQLAEIEQRILYTIMREPGGFPAGSLLRVSSIRKAGWAPTELGYGEFTEVLRTVRQLILGVRGIDADDVTLPERTTDSGVDVVELESRASGAGESLRTMLHDLQTALAASDTVDVEALRDLMLRAASLGVAGAVPLSAAGDLPADRAVLLAQASSIQDELAGRADQLKALASDFDAGSATPEQRIDATLKQLRIVFGKVFVVLPRFTPANADELAKAVANSEKIQGGDPFAATTWFQRVARIRDGAARLQAALNYSEALRTGDWLQLTIAQLPYDAGDRWVGLPLETGKIIPGGKLSLVVQSAVPVDVRQPLAGVLIDEWVEVVPSATETTGISFQYDQPNAAPPQTILVAVPPEIGLPWTIWSLQQVLLETLDLARIRAIDPDALDEVGHYLPALYFAVNAQGHTVSTDFLTIK